MQHSFADDVRMCMVEHDVLRDMVAVLCCSPAWK
jgi:hypothetical protein